MLDLNLCQVNAPITICSKYVSHMCYSLPHKRPSLLQNVLKYLYMVLTMILFFHNCMMIENDEKITKHKKTSFVCIV